MQQNLADRCLERETDCVFETGLPSSRTLPPKHYEITRDLLFRSLIQPPQFSRSSPRTKTSHVWGSSFPICHANPGRQLRTSFFALFPSRVLPHGPGASLIQNWKMVSGKKMGRGFQKDASHILAAWNSHSSSPY